MAFFKNIFTEKRATRNNRKKLDELTRALERAYGVKLSFNSAEELSAWLMSKDPYMAELIYDG